MQRKTTLHDGGTQGTRKLGTEGLQLIYNSANSVSVGVGSCFTEGGSFINLQSELTASSLSLTSGTWYHLYLYLSGETPSLEVVTTAPTPWRGVAYSKTGDTSRRYVGSIRAIASNTMANFEHSPFNNMILYKAVLDSVGLRFLSAGAATTDTDVSCAAGVPVTSTTAVLRFTNLGTTNTSIGSSASYVLDLGNATSGYNHIFANWSLDSSQQFRYKNLAVGGALYVDGQGYYFKR